MRRSRFGLLLASSFLFSATAFAHPANDAENREVSIAAPDYYADGQAALADILAAKQRNGNARNLIIFIGDGMGVSTITAGRIYAGQKNGGDGESHVLAMDALPHAALVKTYSHDFQVADSAATATALVTGSKTKSGMLSVGPMAERNDCAAGTTQRLDTLFEIGADAGKATGIISTARITHATPASTYAHVPNRGWESDNELPENGGCTDIATQMIAWDHGGGLDVILGGGRSNFLPKTMADPEYADKTGWRSDGRNLVTEWQAKHPQGQFVYDAAGFAQLDIGADGPVLGLFEPSHMQYEADRVAQTPTEPALAELVALAIQKLSGNKDGFILMVEGGRIDHAHHGGNAKRALEDTIAFDTAIAKALEMVNLDETLVLVTADHSHVFTIAGYPPRNNPILGLGSIDEDGQIANGKDGKPYTTLGYANGPGAVMGEREDVTHVDTQALDYRQQALVPTSSESHGGEDVALKAAGPQSHLFHGTIEQNTVFHIAKHILGL